MKVINNKVLSFDDVILEPQYYIYGTIVVKNMEQIFKLNKTISSDSSFAQNIKSNWNDNKKHFDVLLELHLQQITL